MKLNFILRSALRMFAAQQHFYRMDQSVESLVSYSASKLIPFQIAVLMPLKQMYQYEHII